MIEILDSTLREGEQTPYVNFMPDEKVEIARLLDRVGVEMIEAGDPSVSSKIALAIKKITALNLKPEIVAHSLATRSGIEKAAECGVDRVVVFYPTSSIHLEKKMHKTEGQALEIIQEHVQYAHQMGLKVRFTPEDASRTNLDFLVRACNTAIEAGADRISFADTLGIMQPHEIYQRIQELRERLLLCKIDLHCHNDYGLALANAMAGIRGGADCIHTTINGLGERTGIPDLCETIMAFHNLEGYQKYNLQPLMEISAYMERISGFLLAPNKPITGLNAFSHKSGVHTNGVLKDPRTYESFDPAVLGRERKIVIDKYTGKLAVSVRLDEYGIKVSPEELDAVVLAIKEAGDARKHLFDTDIIEIAEQATGRAFNIISSKIEAIVMIEVESHVYTSSVVRRLRNFPKVSNLFEITGDYDISTYVSVENVYELNALIEELRTLPGVKQTETRLVLKKYNGIGVG
jgi:2-isopropylmalate synthase